MYAPQPKPPVPHRVVELVPQPTAGLPDRNKSPVSLHPFSWKCQNGAALTMPDSRMSTMIPVPTTTEVSPGTENVPYSEYVVGTVGSQRNVTVSLAPATPAHAFHDRNSAPFAGLGAASNASKARSRTRVLMARPPRVRGCA